MTSAPVRPSTLAATGGNDEIPVVIAGVATTHFGLHQTALVYCAAIAAIAAAAAGSLMLRRRGPATSQPH